MKTENQKLKNQKDSLQDIINKNQYIITGLKDNGAWKAVLEDVNKNKQKLDDTWQYISDPVKMMEFRITKLAVMKIVNLISDYEADSRVALENLKKIEDTEGQIPADVDNN